MRAIELRTLDQPVLAELSEAPEGYAAPRALVLTPHADLVQAVARQTLDFVQQRGIGAPWGGYLAVDPVTLVVVGTCAFKGPPDVRGEVEIAYFTFPTHEGQGYATAMGRALCDRAAASIGVKWVRAHTLRDRNASVRVLEKLGFTWDGDVQDPEDGPVWRWVWQVPAGRSSGPVSP
jgi:ribosomal-protein-alanine N-acetyltransferase